MPNPATLPWINSHGELAHPDAPRGGGGPGVARIPRPLGFGAGANPLAIPAPDSSAARQMTPTQLADKVGDGNPKTPEDIAKEKQQANQELAIYVVQTSEEMVGTPTVGRKECFDLLDVILRKLGGKSANDFEHVTGGKDQDYKWGEPVTNLAEVRPGDLIQFRNFETTYTPDRSDRPPYTSIRGPQHSSIVLGKNADGSLDIAEQHVIDHVTNKVSEVILRNRLDYIPTKRKMADGSTVTITVSGTIWFYHPVAKPKTQPIKQPK